MNSYQKIISSGTKIVVDSGNLDMIKKYGTSDVTTNPSLVLKSIEYYENCLTNTDLEEVLVKIGLKILKEINGNISIEINPSYSYDTDNTVKRARKIIKMFQDYGVSKERIYIKIVATWNGIKSAEILEKEGIKCNMTLVLSLFQAAFCSNVNATLISPFIGRVTDWYKNNGYEINSLKKDYGVINVLDIIKYLKDNNSKTMVMGASFRNIDQIKSLDGVDLLTISPNLIEELMNDYTDNDYTDIILPSEYTNSFVDFSEEEFNKNVSNNKVVKEKLDEGINTFIKDTNQLMKILIKKSK